ncbi:MAG TPA: hypothetical protein VIL28_10615 [Steroidobacteraceae bacterium]
MLLEKYPGKVRTLMNARSGVLSALCVFLTACSPALVEEPGEFATASPVVCSDVTPTGSHLKQRVCTTEAEIAEEAARAREEVAEAQQRQRDELAILEQERMRTRTIRLP